MSPSPSPGWANYTRGDYAALPGDDADLETAYSASDYTDVSSDNDVRVGQTATDEYAIHQFKDYVGAALTATFRWNGQTDRACTLSIVVLQIYNRVALQWDTIASDNLTGADTDFDLQASGVALANYKDAGNVIACRVYQQAA